MRKQTNHKVFPIATVLLLATTLVLLFGDQCGIVGRHVVAFSKRMLGNAGIGIFLGTTWSVLIILADLQLIVFERRLAEKAKSAKSTRRPTTKTDPVLADVRSSLANLGYATKEYEPLVAMMNPARGREALIRDALSKLRVN